MMARLARCSFGHEFSPALGVCPECGKPSRSGGRKGRFWLFVLGGASVSAIIGLILADSYFLARDTMVHTNQADYKAALRHVCILQDAEARFKVRSGRFTSDPKELRPELELFFGPTGMEALNPTFTLENYLFALKASKNGYKITAVHVLGAREESPAIFADQTMTLRVSTAGVADESSPQLDLLH